MADDPGGEGEDDERIIELSSIAAIYPELSVDPVSFTASIDVQVEPIHPLPILFPSADGAPPQKGGKQGARSTEDQVQNIHHLSHLPPLTLRLELPDGYPAERPPVFSLNTQYFWLPEYKLQELNNAGHMIWEVMGRDQVVFSYIDYLQESAEKGFDLARDEGTVLEIAPDLKVSLLDFDMKARRAKFEKETFECGICLEPKKGIVCHRLLLCSHVFCVECLQDFYNTCIIEGDVGNVKCMAPGCGTDLRHLALQDTPEIQKRRREEDKSLEPSELLQIPLEQETVQRYINLKRKKRLESNRSTIYCPRQWCQGPARSSKSKPLDDEIMADLDHEEVEPQSYDRDVDPDKLPPPAERLAICEDCTFAFCKVCKASWHGEYFTCFPRSQFELTAEEKASEDYMKLHTQPCPTCDARAQKTHGCNHMICFKCDTHFCYLCGAYLDKGNPYTHFNNKKSGCYMRLWELEAGDDGEIGQGFGGGNPGIPSDDDDDDVDDSDDDDIELEINVVPAPPEVRPPPVRPPDVVVRLPPPARPGGLQAADPPRARQGGGGAVQNQNGAGLHRFIQMAQNDEENDWDSDEMEEEDDELRNWE